MKANENLRFVKTQDEPAEENTLASGGAGTICGGYPCGNFSVGECKEHIDKMPPDTYPTGSTSASLNTTSMNDVASAHGGSSAS